MPRSKTTYSIESKISKVKDKIKKNKERYEALCDELTQLMEERDKAQCREILAAIKRSGKSFSEVMTFLGK